MDIYQYDDFKVFLKDLFEGKKKEDSNFSHRKFATLAQIKNPGLLVDIIKGKRRLSEKVMKKTEEIFQLKPLEIDFFELLVEYGQCKNQAEKESLYKEILTRRNHSSFFRLNPGKTRYYEDTNYALIVAAVECTKFKGDYEKLGQFLSPSVPTGKVKKYIRDLCEWGLIKQEGNGKYKVVHHYLEPPATLKTAVKKMNKDWILQAPEVLFTLGPNERHISTQILTISSKTREKIMDRLEAWRREIVDLVKKDKNPEHVMQLSLMYLPKSEGKK